MPLFPSHAEVNPGDWVMLRDHWVVGPILEPPYPEEKHAWSLQVKVGDYPTGMTVVTGEDDPHSDSLRRIIFSGTKEEVLAYAHQCALADRVMEEIIEEEKNDLSVK